MASFRRTGQKSFIPRRPYHNQRQNNQTSESEYTETDLSDSDLRWIHADEDFEDLDSLKLSQDTKFQENKEDANILDIPLVPQEEEGEPENDTASQESGTLPDILE